MCDGNYSREILDSAGKENNWEINSPMYKMQKVPSQEHDSRTSGPSRKEGEDRKSVRYHWGRLSWTIVPEGWDKGLDCFVHLCCVPRCTFGPRHISQH